MVSSVITQGQELGPFMYLCPTLPWGESQTWSTFSREGNGQKLTQMSEAPASVNP